MRNDKGRAEGGPDGPRSLCGVCNRPLHTDQYDAGPNGCYGDIDLACYHIGYERRTRQVDESIATTERALRVIAKLVMGVQSARNVLLNHARQNPGDTTCRVEAEALADLLGHAKGNAPSGAL